MSHIKFQLFESTWLVLKVMTEEQKDTIKWDEIK